MTRVRLLSIALLLSASGGFYWFLQNQPVEPAASPDAKTASVLPDRATTGMMARQYPRRESAWRSREKAFYQALLSKGRFDVLVVPFQVQDYALDSATRSLMAAELALAIETGQHSRIPAPYLVGLALGDGERRFDDAQVYRLAEKLGVSRIVWGYVGHDRNYRMILTLRHQDRSSNGFPADPEAVKQREFRDVAFSDENPPIEAYQALLPEVLATLGVDASAFSAPKPESRFDPMAIPVSPLDVADGPAEPARDAYLLQLLASLAPTDAEGTRERLAAKSLLAVYAMSPASPNYRALKARALMLLGMRPAALKALGEPKTEEEQTLYAALNGNLPEAGTLAGKTPLGVATVLARIEENAIAVAYGTRNAQQALDAAKSLELPGQAWPFLAQRAFTDGDNWSQYRNLGLKTLLDKDFPIADFTLDGLVRGAATLGEEDKLEAILDTSVLTHVRKVLEGEPEKWCCQSVKAQLTALDYLKFIENSATENIMRRASFYSIYQAAPERTMAFLARIESTYKDHPRFALARAQAETAMARTADSAAKPGHIASAVSDAINAIHWEQGQSHIAKSALETWVAASENDLRLDNPYADDYPIRPLYPAWEYDGLASRGIIRERAALQNATFEVEAILQLHKSLLRSATKEEADELLRSLSGRFHGSSERTLLLAEDNRKRNDIQAAKQYYRENIRFQPGNWAAYGELAKLLFAEGKNEEAFKVVMSYPGFSGDTGENSVELSNDAYSMGSMFYWIGDFKLAAPLYKIAAELDTGSEASIASGIRLKLMEDDYAGALAGTLHRAQRYGSSYGYRDYLGMLHALGYSKEAWNAFNVLLTRLETPHIWETVLVGQQRAVLSLHDIADWAKREPLPGAGRQFSYAAMHLLRAGVTDRMPAPELPSLVAGLDRPVWKVQFRDGVSRVLRGSHDGRIQMMMGPQADENMGPGELGHNFEKVLVKSDLVYFAESYLTIRKGDFAAARATLQEATTLFDMSSDSLGYVLPYYAFAAAKSGDVAAVKALLGQIPFEHQRFDYHLAKAVLTAVSGNKEASLKHLDLALHHRPYTENRPLYTEYQYAEICEWLFEATGKDEFRLAALSWAKKNQVFQPWYAWPYAMEAKLSRNAKERPKAIAMAYYLDQNSERLGALPKSEIEAATKQFAHSNPFLKMLKNFKDHSA